MRILLDECCPPSLAAALRYDGHDVVHALEASTGFSDDYHAQAAFADQRILVTADYDFGDMAFRDVTDFFGLIILAPELGNLHDEAAVICRRISAIGADAQGYVTIIGRDRDRPRRLRSRSH